MGAALALLADVAYALINAGQLSEAAELAAELEALMAREQPTWGTWED